MIAPKHPPEDTQHSKRTTTAQPAHLQLRFDEPSTATPSTARPPTLARSAPPSAAAAAPPPPPADSALPTTLAMKIEEVQSTTKQVRVASQAMAAIDFEVTVTDGRIHERLSNATHTTDDAHTRSVTVIINRCCPRPARSAAAQGRVAVITPDICARLA